ncbi:MAG TPA: kelch repeat-containing protein [Candidatus Sulfotelmatobacter sp.]|nr:kelch repeat-containing protein [Candidatus Sulfotelmatobacter sp.]
MAFARQSHTATLLPNGSVLLTGGMNATGALATAELFHPASNTFTLAGNMRAARVGHTATLLPDGRVLITGGSNASGALATAEFFHPTSGTFTSAGTMRSARVGHTATLLNSGKVLVAGGGTATAELFDPRTGQFTAVGEMSASRSYHTATRLISGEVLIAGGTALDAGGTALGELFNPTTEKFTPTANPGTAALFVAAAMLANGNVLLTGGELAGRSCGFCGAPLISSTNVAFLFNNGTAKFSETGSVSNSLASHTATLLTSGQVLVAGGRFINSFCDRGCPRVLTKATTVAELYNPATGNFSATGNLKTARSSHTATLLGNGKVLVAGGVDVNGNALASAELYQ